MQRWRVLCQPDFLRWNRTAQLPVHAAGPQWRRTSCLPPLPRAAERESSVASVPPPRKNRSACNRPNLSISLLNLLEQPLHVLVVRGLKDVEGYLARRYPVLLDG